MVNQTPKTMEQFCCYVCGMMSEDQDEITIHMNKVHNIKVEDKIVNQKYCPQGGKEEEFVSTSVKSFPIWISWLKIQPILKQC